jgi:hypothetical protein
MAAKLCFVVIDHLGDEFFDDIVAGLEMMCPSSDIVWYDSGNGPRTGVAPPRLACSRPLEYAKITPFFLDVFEWAANEGYDHVVNVESDMAFISRGFEDFLSRAMPGVDHMVPHFARRTPRSSRWRPYHSLRPELPELLEILGTDTTHQGFSPGQVFSARYVDRLLSSRMYPELRAFVERNQLPGRSFTLQEVLLPTLPELLGLVVQGYPDRMSAYNRYRPYHSLRSLRSAHSRGDVPFVHPVRRDPQHDARRFIRSLCGEPAGRRSPV